MWVCFYFKSCSEHTWTAHGALLLSQFWNVLIWLANLSTWLPNKYSDMASSVLHMIKRKQTLTPLISWWVLLPYLIFYFYFIFLFFSLTEVGVIFVSYVKILMCSKRMWLGAVLCVWCYVKAKKASSNFYWSSVVRHPPWHYSVTFLDKLRYLFSSRNGELSGREAHQHQITSTLYHCDDGFMLVSSSLST